MDKEILRKITFQGPSINTPALMLSYYRGQLHGGPQMYCVVVQYSNAWDENTFWFEDPIPAMAALGTLALHAAMQLDLDTEFDGCIRSTIQI